MAARSVSHHTGDSGSHRQRFRPPQRDAVQQNAVIRETIAKERKYFKPHSSFTINPFRSFNAVTGKPHSPEEFFLEEGTEDPTMRAIINQAQKPPTEKQLFPETSSQEYGWISTPLIESNRGDERLHHPRKDTDITKCRIELPKPEDNSRPASQRYKHRYF